MSEKKIPERKDIKIEHRWDLSKLYEDDAQWEEHFREIEGSINTYRSFMGRLSESVDIFIEAVNFDLSVSRDIEKLYTYSHLKSDEDRSNQHYLAMYQKAMNLYTRTAEISSYLVPEIQSVPDEVMQQYRQDHRLDEYGFYLENVLRFKPHTQSPQIEEILAMSGEIAGAPAEIFSQLDNADLKFGFIKDDHGNERELSHGNFSSFLMSPAREVRERAFFQYYKTYDDHKNSIAASLDYSNKKDFFFSRVRKFNSSRKRALFSDNVSEEVYDNLIDTVRDNLAPLFKYLDFRKKALALDELRFYDTYVPIVGDVDFNMPFKEAVDVCVAALAPLGDTYTSVLRDGLLGGWVDRYENRGKRSGAYSSGCYDSPPYILMNYREDNINSLYTLIHEAGHSMHSCYSKENQPYLYHGYTIFVAEVASTFNETLLSRHLLEQYSKDAKMSAYILNREVDNIRATLYRQTMFAEFEKVTHEIIEKNMPLTLEVVREEYKKLLQIYFGNALVIDDVLSLECLRIPHFYSAFYVYKYATGISAAISLAEKAVKDERARDRYLDFLKLGGSMYPLDELKLAGIDMTSHVPVQEALDHFDGLVDRLIAVYAEL